MDNYIETWKKVITSPSAFYESMPKEGGYSEPLKFAAISIFVMAVGSAIINFVFRSLAWNMVSEMFETSIPSEMTTVGPTVVISQIIGSFISGMIGLFIIGLILFIFFKIVGGTGSYEGTVRILSYSSAVGVLAWIPLVGWLFSLYGIYLDIVGGKYVHSISMGRSAIAVLIPIVLVILLVVVLLILLFAAGIFVASSGLV